MPRIRIPIGDWSGDGHGHCDYYLFECSHGVEAVREVYFAAKEKIGKAWPEEICSSYDETHPLLEDYRELEALGFSFKNWDHGDATDEGMPRCTDKGMLDLVIWFIHQADPSIVFTQVENDADMLPFYGFDDQDRHIRYFGYGIWND